MNRRKFIMSSAMGVGALSMFPRATFANSSNIWKAEDLTKTLGTLSNVSASDLPDQLLKAYQDMILYLNQSNYRYNANELIKVGDNCYLIPLEKKSIVGFNANELGLLVNQKEGSQFYILDENTSEEFNRMAKNYNLNMQEIGQRVNVSEFISPVKVLEEKKGKENLFSYKNKFNTTITLKSSGKKTRAIIS